MAVKGSRLLKNIPEIAKCEDCACKFIFSKEVNCLSFKEIPLPGACNRFTTIASQPEHIREIIRIYK
jgi:hypothetical protein